jgi:hypothetical protein
LREEDEGTEHDSGSGADKRIFTPRDQLFEEGTEYDSVFKSRPRVVHSPLVSPSGGGGEEEEEFSMVGALRGLDDGYDESPSRVR